MTLVKPTNEAGRGVPLPLSLRPGGSTRRREQPEDRVCLVMEANGWLYLFPISGQVPQPREQGEERLCEVVPETEQRRIGLGPEKVSHLILDDYKLYRPDA